MFTTVESVKSVTGYDVTADVIVQAQAILEAIIGRTEMQIDNVDDLTILNKATAFQAAYMSKNYSTVYEQIAVRMMAQTDGNVVLDTSLLAPYLAPLTMFAISNLSWRRSRSVRTGSMFSRPVGATSWETN